MSRTRAKRSVRSPFVVTLAAAATIVAAGCGARVDGVTSDAGADTQPIECPSSEPSNGGACSGEMSCSYGNCYGMATTTAQCRNGEWQVMNLSCNPPPPECPRTEPAVGSACRYYGPGSCNYPDRCLSGAMKSFSCISGTWTSEMAPVLAACPTTPPVEGSSCADCAGRYPSTCVYEWCGSYPSRESKCDPVTKTWSTRWASCNPPPPDVDGGFGPMETGPDDPSEPMP